MTTKTEVAQVEKTEVAPAAMPTPMDMINHAVQNGAGVEVMERLMALQERFEANNARKAFDAAMSAAKSEMPAILKNRAVDFTSSKGRTNYRHEDLGEIAKTVDPILSKHGLSYRFRTEQKEGGAIQVTCVVAHRDGHSEENSLQAGRDDSGNKNNLQAVGSTITYLQRYTLKAALGLAASNDDDAAKSEQKLEENLKPDQVAIISDLIDKTDTDIEKFCETFKVGALPELRVADFDSAVRALNIKLAKKLSEGETK